MMTLKNLFPKKIIVLLTFLMGWTVSSQNILISQGGTVNVTGGETFLDAGGASGNDGNTSFTITLMPPSGKSVCVDFTSFSSFEALEIFDGTTVAATNIGSLKGNYGVIYNAGGSPYNTGQPVLGSVVQAELKPGIFCANNATGALTFRFTNSSASQSTGWVGTVSTFVNSVSGCKIDLAASKTSICQSEMVTLTANGSIGASAIDNNFNSGSIGTGWNATPGGVSFVTVLSCQPNNGYNTNKPDNTTFAWMQNVTAPRVLESNSFDVSNGGVVSFDFRAASDDNGGNGCEANDDKEGVYVQYSTDNGTTWTNMKLMFPSVESNINASANIGAGTYVYNWNRTTIPIPAAAQTANTRFRWYQHQSTTGSQDSWGIDDVKIIKNNTTTLTITDLSTNTVLATTLNLTLQVVVSPTTTTNYRATISDGTTSCFEDITINVNSTPATTIDYAGDPFLTTASPVNVTVTNGPVTGTYSATPAGLTINATTGQITPSTSTPGTYTVSVSSACGTANKTVTIASSTCATCATATCDVTSITTTTAALGQTGITTAINNAGDVLGLSPLTPGQSVTVCVPVTVVTNSTLLGFKQNFQASAGCGNPSEQVITYQLRPASNCSATPITPSRTNASSVGSGFNPEWDNLTAGDYVLCFTMNVTNLSICNPVDLQGLGYYNVVPPTPACQDYQIELYDNDGTSIVHSGTTFSCSDPGVYLGPSTDPTVYDSGLPFQNYNITITATSGNLNNLVLNRYDAGTNTLAEALTVTPNVVIRNYFLRPSPGQYYKLDKTNTNSGIYTYTIVDVISGATVASGTWTITGGAESAASITLIPQGTASYSGPGVTNGFDVTGVNDYTNDRGIGFFNPALAGLGTHTITYTWNNGLAAPNNCTLTRTKTVTVSTPSSPTATSISICSGSTATLTATGLSTGATVKWYDAATNGNLLFTGNPFTSATLTAATSFWVTQSINGCESNRVKVDVTIKAGTDATYTLTPSTCAPGSISFASISPTGTTFDWVSGPTGFTFPTGFTTPATTNTSLSNLPAGTYCVDITSPNVAGGLVTTTLLTENFETNAPNWTINNSGGNNIFVINNTYAGATCTVTGVPFTVPAVPNQGAWATAGPQSKYLHIKATTTCGFSCAEASFPPANANFCSTTSDQKFTLNTPLNTTGKTNVTVSFQYINKGTDVDDFGALEYSTNGGTTWTQAGANLTGQTSWLNQVTTLPAWNNQSSLLFRFRWKNDASGSSDPPLCLDEIIITAQETAIASCGTTKQECVTINPIVTPTISCGTSTTNSVQFSWPAITGATSFTATHTVNGGSVINDGTITSPFTINGLNPNDAVAITITPAGGSGTCFGSASLTCTANDCPTILSPSASQTLCLGGDPTALSVSTTFTGTNAISYVYFNTQQTGANMYTGGTSLASVTPSAGTATFNPGVLGSTGSLPNSAGTYFVYAIANPAPAGTSCRPFQEIQVIVLPNNTATAPSSTPTLCISTVLTDITHTTTGATGIATTTTNYGLPAGVSASWTSNTITISGTPTESGAFNYSIPLTGGCGSINATGTITVTPDNLVTTPSSTPTLCISTVLTNITHATSGATGIATTTTNYGLPTGVSASWASNTITISGTPTESGTFNYTIPLTGGCSNVDATGTITVSPNNTVTAATSTPTLCISTALTNITHTTAGATGIATTTNYGLPAGVSASWASNTITISGTPTASGTFNYTIPLTGGCSNVNATGTITVTPNNTVTAATSTPTLCIGTALTDITHTTTGATGIATTTTNYGLPAGVSASWTSNTITISGTPTASGTFNYSIPLTGGCGSVNATGTITVLPNNTVTAPSSTPTLCISTVLTNITHTTTTATGIATTTTNYGLPAGVSASWASNTITISGTPTESGTFNYTIPLTGGCSNVNATGTITVSPQINVSVSTIAPTCSSNGTTSITNFNNSLSYTFNPSGPTIATGGIINGMILDTNYTLTVSDGVCTSSPTPAFINASMLVTPSVPTITSIAASCLSDGSSTISNYNNSLQYTFTPTGPSVYSTGLITGMILGTNYTVIAGNGNCTSLASVSFNNAAQFPTPTFTAQFTKDICSGSSTDIVLTSSSSGITYEWTATATHLPGYVTQGTGSTINQTLTTDAVLGTINISVIPKLGTCSGTPLSISIFVHENPVINSISFVDNQICSGETINVNITGDPTGLVYDWVAVTNGVQLAGGVTSGTSLNGSISLGATTTSSTASGTVFLNVTPRRTVGVSTCFGPTVASGLVTVNPIPGTPFSAASSDEICSGSNPTLSVQVSPFITGNVANWTIIETTGVIVTGDQFGNGVNFPLTFPNTIFTTSSNNQGTVKIRVSTLLGDCVGGTTDFIVKVNPLAPISITDHYICVNSLGQTTTPHLLDTGLSDSSTDYEFEWYSVSSTGITTLIIGENDPTYLVNAPGNYMVLVRDLRFSTECESTKTITISTVTQAEGIDYTVTDAFSSNATITVIVNPQGTGHLIYSLNDGPWQDSNVFQNLAPGSYTINVSDTEGCTFLSTNAQIIGYPKYFTPNGDGFNDTWNVIGIKDENKAVIYIFDRFGKLVKQISPTSFGWDGTYNGEMLPSTDYWFTIDYTENNNQKNFKAHFSLKR